MKLSLEILHRHGACSEGIKWYSENGSPKTVSKTINALLQSNNPNRHQWSNWLLSEMLSPNNKTRYAIYAAELSIGIFEKQYPNDRRPRQAIEAAKAYLKKPSRAAEAAAWAAAGAAAWDAARAAAWAAWAAGAAGAAVYEKIINYGLSLIRKGNSMKHVTGTIIRAGTMDVEGEMLTGFFIECSGKDIMDLFRLGMYNERVAVILDRRGKNRVEGPAFRRTVEEQIGVKHANEK